MKTTLHKPILASFAHAHLHASELGSVASSLETLKKRVAAGGDVAKQIDNHVKVCESVCVGGDIGPANPAVTDAVRQ